MKNFERSCVIIKPDSVEKRLIGKILEKIENTSFNLESMELTYASERQLVEHYKNLKNREFFRDLIKYMLSGPIIVLKVSGDNAIDELHKLAGNTDPNLAQPETIRGNLSVYGGDKMHNFIHTSDSKQNAINELNIWFDEDRPCNL
ncbi:nucleoside-diphosphate kinase [Liquorilactobacillus vini]|uniref:nucleoside-diphosphate kinase n=1 Tax=Liquorilactobacillus vini TaxID=238015 RepID=UPI0002E03569|nr:nucleoside-diphosphate kinase [Liquorilactobacillus vini]